jgi:hypothetical protein
MMLQARNSRCCSLRVALQLAMSQNKKYIYIFLKKFSLLAASKVFTTPLVFFYVQEKKKERKRDLKLAPGSMLY